MTFHGETCPDCGSDQSMIITTTPRDYRGKLIEGMHRWQCTKCHVYFLVDAL